MTIWAGLIRHILTAAGGGLVTNGYLAGSELDAAIGAVLTLIGIGLSVLEKRQRASH